MDRGSVSTEVPHDVTVLEVVKELNLVWQISYNKGAEMLLPNGVDRDLGLKKALAKLNLSFLPKKTRASRDEMN